MWSRTLATLVVAAAPYRTVHVFCAGEPFSGVFFDGEASTDSGLEKIQLLDIARRSLGEVRTPTNTLFMLINGSVCSIALGLFGLLSVKALFVRDSRCQRARQLG